MYDLLSAFVIYSLLIGLFMDNLSYFDIHLLKQYVESRDIYSEYVIYRLLKPHQGLRNLNEYKSRTRR
jgi:hypothetical protein